MAYFLGIDVGLTKTKAVRFTEDGRSVASGERRTPLSGDEIDMELLWQRVEECIDEAGLEGVQAISVSGHGNGLYALDRENRVFMPAVSSMSTRAADVPEGSWPGQTRALLRHFQKEKRIHTVLFCKDWINFKLTGNLATDYTDTSAGGVWGDPLPPVGRSTDRVGYYRGIPVAGGMFDVNACALGSGLAGTGKYSIISGTWGINSCLTEEYVEDAHILQCCRFADSQHYICIESAPTSCVNLDWFLKNVLGGMELQTADEIAANTETELLYLPYIFGGTNCGAKTGAFINLSERHTRADFIRAIFEGVAMGHRLQLEQLQRAGLCHPEAILSGGAARSDIWCRIFADVTGLRINTSAEKQTGALGGAICGAVMTGFYPDMKTAVEHMTRTGKSYRPEKNYGGKYADFKMAIERTR